MPGYFRKAGAGTLICKRTWGGLVRQGRDPQLEKAIEHIMAELQKNPPRKLVRPAYPRYETLK